MVLEFTRAKLKIKTKRLLNNLLPHTSNEIWTYNSNMRFALSNDERIEAIKGAKGVCPCCGNDLVAKCGEVYIHHWAHKKKCGCL